MGTSSSKKTPSKKGRSAAHDRRSPSKTLKAEQTPKSEKPKTPSSTPRDTTYTHNLPTDEQKKGNGRVTGRSLIMWNRPRMAEKLILHLHYECVRHKVNIPWDAIAHRLRPGSSGAAVLQHVNRLRKELLSEGHLVPPPAQKASPATPFDPSIRGYVRDTASDDKHATRPVGFDEKMDDAKINLPDAFDALGEGEDDEESFADVSFTAAEDEIQPPVTPTPIRHAAPRRPMSAPHNTAKLQNLQRGSGGAAPSLVDADPFSDIVPPSFMLNRAEGFQPLSTKNFLQLEKQTPQMMSGGHLFDPFSGKLAHPPVKPNHGQVSPGGQAPFEQGQQPYFMGQPFHPHYAGYYGMSHAGFMPLPPYGFSMPTPPNPRPLAEQRNPLSSPITIEDRDVSASPVSSPIGGQLQALQPAAESPEQQHLGELTTIFAYDDEALGNDLLLKFLASN